MNIAIIGGGVFGAMTAIRLAELNETVTLFERLPGLLQGTSGNANRLHLGFHYPRDEETARQCVRGFRRFHEQFEGAILDHVNNAYFIASEGSLTSPRDFLSFCDRVGLRFNAIDPDALQPAVRNVALGVTTEEVVFDASALRDAMAERLRRLGVSVQLESAVTGIDRDGADAFELAVNGGKAHFDAVIKCSYPEINRLTARLGHAIEMRQYEYTAVPIVALDLPAPVSLTILDGPFMALMPFGRTGDYLLYHVKHSVVAEAHQKLLDPSWLDPKTSPFAAVDRERWFEILLEDCCRFVPALRGARLKRVLLGPRIVLDGREDTDTRPSIVTEHEPRYVTVLSGKIDHCIWVADEVARTLGCG